MPKKTNNVQVAEDVKHEAANNSIVNSTHTLKEKQMAKKTTESQEMGEKVSAATSRGISSWFGIREVDSLPDAVIAAREKKVANLKNKIEKKIASLLESRLIGSPAVVVVSRAQLFEYGEYRETTDKDGQKVKVNKTREKLVKLGLPTHYYRGVIWHHETIPYRVGDINLTYVFSDHMLVCVPATEDLGDGKIAVRITNPDPTARKFHYKFNAFVDGTVESNILYFNDILKAVVAEAVVTVASEEDKPKMFLGVPVSSVKPFSIGEGFGFSMSFDMAPAFSTDEIASALKPFGDHVTFQVQGRSIVVYVYQSVDAMPAVVPSGTHFVRTVVPTAESVTGSTKRLSIGHFVTSETKADEHTSRHISVFALPGAQRAYYKSLDNRGKKDFLAMSEDKRKEAVNLWRSKSEMESATIGDIIENKKKREGKGE